DAEGADGRPRPGAGRRRRRVRQGWPERAGGRRPAVAADRRADGWRHAGVMRAMRPCRSGFSRELFVATNGSEELAAEAAPTGAEVGSGGFVVAGFTGFQQFLHRPEQLAERMRRLVALAFV